MWIPFLLQSIHPFQQCNDWHGSPAPVTGVSRVVCATNAGAWCVATNWFPWGQQPPNTKPQLLPLTSRHEKTVTNTNLFCILQNTFHFQNWAQQGWRRATALLHSNGGVNPLHLRLALLFCHFNTECHPFHLCFASLFGSLLIPLLKRDWECMGRIVPRHHCSNMRLMEDASLTLVDFILTLEDFSSTQNFDT